MLLYSFESLQLLTWRYSAGSKNCWRLWHLLSISSLDRQRRLQLRDKVVESWQRLGSRWSYSVSARFGRGALIAGSEAREGIRLYVPRFSPWWKYIKKRAYNYAFILWNSSHLHARVGYEQSRMQCCLEQWWCKWSKVHFALFTGVQ